MWNFSKIDSIILLSQFISLFLSFLVRKKHLIKLSQFNPTSKTKSNIFMWNFSKIDSIILFFSVYSLISVFFSWIKYSIKLLQYAQIPIAKSNHSKGEFYQKILNHIVILSLSLYFCHILVGEKIFDYALAIKPDFIYKINHFNTEFC